MAENRWVTGVKKKTLIRGYIYTVLASEAKKTSLLPTIIYSQKFQVDQTLLDKIQNGSKNRDHPRDHSLYLNVIIYVYRLYTLLGTNISDFPV